MCGWDWAECLVESLSEQSQAKVEKYESEKTFKFGGGERRKSCGFWRIPCFMAGRNVMLETDIVNADIPCLLSKPALKRAGTVLRLDEDKAEIFGNEINLDCTSSGHYALEIKDCKNEVEGSYDEEILVNELSDDYQSKVKQLVKLHKHFAHPVRATMNQLLKESGNIDSEVREILDKIYAKCDLCHRFASTKPRPAVGLSLARDFNECVAMDLKIFKSKNLIILYLIDVFTRYTLASIVPDKKAETITDVVVKNWILGPFGPPRKFLADTGGEFANEYYRDMCENLNIEVLKTGSESPFQNGLCERNHCVVDGMLLKLLADEPDRDLEIALASAVTAKNTLAMNNGFSPLQLVTGKNPVLPSINDNPPALEARSISTAFTERVNAALSARTAFVEVDSSARLRRALCKKIRVHGEPYNQGDKVYYKRGKDNKWHGPGTVIGVDGKVIFVKHGRLHITASPSRLIKANHVFKSYGSVIDSLGPQQESLTKKKNDVSSLRKVDEESEDDDLSTGSSGGHIDTAPAVIAENHAPDGVEVNDAVPSLPQNTENEEHTRRNVARNHSKQKYPKVKDKITSLNGDGDDSKWFNVQVDS